MPGERLDSEGMAEAAQAAPDTVRATVRAALDAAPDSAPSVGAVVLAASARTKVTAQAVAAIATSRVPVPVVTLVDEPAPSWARGGALILSLDGGVTERLLTDAALDGAPVVSLAGDPAARPAPIVETAAALAALDAFGLADGLGADLLAAADVLDARLAVAQSERSPERRLARRIGRTEPLVYGGGPVGAAAATSWKRSVNRNAKAPAFANSVPGLDDDEICGWAQHGDVTRQVFTLVTLRHAFESDDQAHRLDVTADTCDEVTAGVYEMRSEATTPVGALLDLMFSGELLSLALAAMAGIDPGPTPVLDRYR